MFLSLLPVYLEYILLNKTTREESESEEVEERKGGEDLEITFLLCISVLFLNSH